jgi:hypothetical protein
MIQPATFSILHFEFSIFLEPKGPEEGPRDPWIDLPKCPRLPRRAKCELFVRKVHKPCNHIQRAKSALFLCFSVNSSVILFVFKKTDNH